MRSLFLIDAFAQFHSVFLFLLSLLFHVEVLLVFLLVHVEDVSFLLDALSLLFLSSLVLFGEVLFVLSLLFPFSPFLPVAASFVLSLLFPFFPSLLEEVFVSLFPFLGSS